jgi:hypothetical protein
VPAAEVKSPAEEHSEEPKLPAAAPAEALCPGHKVESYNEGKLVLVADEAEESELSNVTVMGHAILRECAASAFAHPELKSITIKEFAMVNDSRGNPQRVKVAEFFLSSKKAKTINWENILLKNIPRAIDKAWDKPGTAYLID